LSIKTHIENCAVQVDCSRELLQNVTLKGQD